jgi:hypothetical protein
LSDWKTSGPICRFVIPANGCKELYSSAKFSFSLEVEDYGKSFAVIVED